MLTKRIIPCLDVKDGRVVKGVNFVSLRDAGDPVEAGAAYSREGADELVFLDITATSDARKTVADMVRRVAEKYGALFFDAYHLSGIGPDNWCEYANSPVAIRPDYDPSEKYEAPYPMWADQAHLNGKGYALLGRAVASFVKENN